MEDLYIPLIDRLSVDGTVLTKSTAMETMLSIIYPKKGLSESI